MDTINKSLKPLMTALEQFAGSFVIKDFVGFLNWEPSLGAVLLTYTGHHAKICSAVKQEADAYALCVRCSNIHQRYCERSAAPFERACFLGITEYSVPIVINDLCIGSISVGHFCQNPADARRRIDALASRLGINREPLQQSFEISVDSGLSDECRLILRFVAHVLAETFRPYMKHAQPLKDTADAPDAGFSIIQNYINNHYTDPNISLKTITKTCNYSPSYISHMFRRRMNVTIRTYMNQLRVVLAKHELKTGSSVSLTAMTCGFNDPNYFCNVFKSLVGIPPSQYARHFRQTGTPRSAFFKNDPVTEPFVAGGANSFLYRKPV